LNIRFLADADLNLAIVTGARDRETALDFLSATEANLAGCSDADVLEFAAADTRILVSHDTSTMPVHFGNRLRVGLPTPGVFLAHQRAPVAQVIDAILLAWSASRPEDWAGQIHYLPSFARYVPKP